jgi:hypothetical protein
MSDATTSRTTTITVPDTGHLGFYAQDDLVGAPLFTDVRNVSNSDLISLVERISPPVPGSSKSWKPFEHYKCRMDNLGVASNVKYSTADAVVDIHNPQHAYAIVRMSNQWSRLADFGLNFGSPPVVGLPSFVSAGAIDGTGFIPAPVNLNDLIGRGLQTILPVIKPKLSLVNSIIELKDFKSLPETLHKLTQFRFFGGLSPLQYLKLHHSQRSPDTGLRAGVRIASDVYLQWMFNVKPLISDVMSIRTSLQQAAKVINDLVTRSGRTVESHWTWRWREFDDSDESQFRGYAPGYPVPTNYGSWTTRRRVLTLPSIFHLEVKYNYNYTDYQVQFAELNTLLDLLGVNFNPRIIWVAIPWSFVVDWVIGVGRWLDQFKRTAMEPKINIQQCLWSIKRQRNISISRTFGGSDVSWLQYSRDIPCLNYVETAFRRALAVPTVAAITTSGLSSSEFTLGAALILARRPRKHKR